MTLDFKKLIKNSVLKQMKIQHFVANVEVFKKEELPEVILQKIRRVFGESFLQDANYTLWVSGNNITKEVIKDSIFNIINDGLQRSANDMSDSDIKILDFDNTATSQSLDQAGITGTNADEVNDRAIADILGDDLTKKEDEKKVNESVEAPAPGEKFCFLKITMK
jgi:superfamily II helicase